jgi:hypothetical protein
VSALNIDAASFTQIKQEGRGDDASAWPSIVLGIVASAASCTTRSPARAAC